MHSSICLRLGMIGWLLGIAWQLVFGVSGIGVGISVVGVCVCVCLLSQYRAAASLLVGFAVVGYYWCSTMVYEPRSGEIASYAGQALTIEGEISSEPAIKETKQTIQLSVRQATERIGRDVLVSGKILVNLPLWPRLAYGDQLTLLCHIERPERIEDFAYDKYLALSQVYALCQNPESIKIEEGRGSILRSLYSSKLFLITKIQSILGEPQAGLLAGLLVGAKQGLPEWLSEQFRRTGVSHIVAISGYNITIIATIVFQATQRWIGRRKSFWLVLLILAVFAILTGAQASVIRATVMGVLVLAARQLGRVAEVSNILLLAACVMVLPQPLTLGYDVGFQLSFLATAGLVYLTPVITPLFNWVTQRVSIRDSLTSTIAATLATLPLIIWQFGQVSVISIVVNMLVLPFIPLVMGLGAIAVLASVMWEPIGLIMAWPVWLGLSYILEVVKHGDRIPWASVAVSSAFSIVTLIGMGLWLIAQRYFKHIFHHL